MKEQLLREIERRLTVEDLEHLWVKRVLQFPDLALTWRGPLTNGYRARRGGPSLPKAQRS